MSGPSAYFIPLTGHEPVLLSLDGALWNRFTRMVGLPRDTISHWLYVYR